MSRLVDRLIDLDCDFMTVRVVEGWLYGRSKDKTLMWGTRVCLRVASLVIRKELEYVPPRRSSTADPGQP